MGDHDATHNPTSEIRRETPFFVPTLLNRHQSGINPLEQEVAKSDIRPVRAPNGDLGSIGSRRIVGDSDGADVPGPDREREVGLRLGIAEGIDTTPGSAVHGKYFAGLSALIQLTSERRSRR